MNTGIFPLLPITPYLRLAIASSLLFFTTAFAEETTFSQKPFTDVSKSSPYFESIEYLRTNNVLKGYIDGTFKPTARINRAEFVKFIINPYIVDTNNLSSCIGVNASEKSQTIFFPDVRKDAWYAPELCLAKVSSLIDGYPDGKYKPGSPINFVEAAKIIASVFELDVKIEDPGAQQWYRPYVQHLSELHAIPTSIKRFDQLLTRGEMAEIVYRLKADKTTKASANMSTIK